MAASKSPVHASPLAMLAVGASIELNALVRPQPPMQTVRNFGLGVAEAIKGLGLQADANRLMRGDYSECAAAKAFSRCLSLLSSPLHLPAHVRHRLLTAISEVMIVESGVQVPQLGLQQSLLVDSARKGELKRPQHLGVALFCARMSSRLG